MKIFEQYFTSKDFSLVDTSDFWHIYKLNNLCVIIDFDICINKGHALDYGLYTRIQNKYMFENTQCFRFLIDDENDFYEFKNYLNRYLLQEEKTIYDTSTYSPGKRYSIDPTPLEFLFENTFEEVYGREALPYLIREYELIDIDGHQRFYDYVLFKKDSLIAIEENGISYHHPQVIGVEKYKNQLLKQNSIVAYGGKVFRWSTSDIKFTDVMCDDIRSYLGNIDSFVYQAKYHSQREVVLYEHQENTLEQIKTERKNGGKTFLVHLPTGTGKTKIVIEDLKSLLIEKPNTKILVMVPTSALRVQWYLKITESLDSNIGYRADNQIFITTYAFMYMNYFKMDSDQYNYIVVDEAHHAPAMTLSKVISHFKPDTLIGLTATDERLDMKKLSKIFGEYEENISLKEAIDKGILSPIRAFRLESNIDLSEVRFNGKDYFSSDLERAIRVDSRNELIADAVLKYFGPGSGLENKSGVIFCVNVQHTKIVAKLLSERGILAKAISSQNKKSPKHIDDYLNGKIQFLCACSLISEGWDAPRTSVIIMARPTMSKVLYLQQLGRGTRKHPGKEALYVIDVVDNYGAFNRPWSVHGIFQLSKYLAFNDIFKRNKEISKELITIEGLYEHERTLEEIDIFTFEQKYSEYLNTDQLARELFVSEGTIKSWIKKSAILPDHEIPIGSRKLYLFHPDNVEKIRISEGLSEHTEETMWDDFNAFIEAGDYTFSYKMPFILGLLENIDETGEADIEKILDYYIEFYLDRHNSGLIIDRPNSPYNRLEFVKDRKAMKRSMLVNPFEKFERKRFMYYSKDLGKIAINSIINEKISIDTLGENMKTDINAYFSSIS